MKNTVFSTGPARAATPKAVLARSCLLYTSRLRRGAFWYYFDSDPSFVPDVEPDIANPCQPIRFSSKDRLLRVFYYGPRISIELFHALADGAGALVFLKTLVAEYLRLGGVEVPCTEGVLDPAEPPDPEEWEDAYPRYATSRARRSLKAGPAYSYTGTPEPFYTLNVIMGLIPVDKVQMCIRDRPRGCAAGGATPGGTWSRCGPPWRRAPPAPAGPRPRRRWPRRSGCGAARCV